MENSIGLWEKKSQKGNVYYYGKTKINGKEYAISLFTVDKANNPKRPDYNIIIKEIAVKEENKQPEKNVYAEFGAANDISDEDLAF